MQPYQKGTPLDTKSNLSKVESNDISYQLIDPSFHDG